MGCGNCSTGSGGKPGGCKGNGGCSTGGCNRLNVYDWLNALPLHDGAKPYGIIEMSFNKGSRKEFYRNNTNYILSKGEWLTVEGTGGIDVGQVSLTGELVKLQLKKYGVKENDVTKRVLHPSTEEELEVSCKNKEREADVLTRSRAIARSLNLDMKLCEVEVQADGKKGTFFYTADQRVDFRELIRVFANDFRLKVEMRQIGARQESAKVGGIGSCGRELCCSTWLTDFKSVNTTAARYQNLSINQTKLSGQCGRLKCCLNYELDTYMDALSVFPDHAESLDTVNGIAHLQKRDIFKNLMWYSFHGNNKQYPLSIARVKEILLLNKEGKKADELHPVELEVRDAKGAIKVDMGYVNDVGQITLKALEKNKKNKKKKSGSGNKSAEGGGQAAAGASSRGGQQGPRSGQGGSGSQGGQPKPQQAKGGSRQGPQQNRPNQGPRPAAKPQNGEKPNRPAQAANTPQGEKVPQQANAQKTGNPQQGNRPKNKPPRPPRPQGPKPGQEGSGGLAKAPAAPSEGA
jgi:cell fate regulator YaaT (PSP1 superfamily)